MAKWGMTEPEVLKAFGGDAKSLAEEAEQSTILRATLGLMMLPSAEFLSGLTSSLIRQASW